MTQSKIYIPNLLLFLVSVYSISLITSCASTKRIQATYIKEIKAHQDQHKMGLTSNEASPLKKEELVYVNYFAPEMNWKLQCKCQEVPQEQTLEIPTYSGQKRSYSLFGIAACKYNDQTLQLYLYKNAQMGHNPIFKNQLFLPFKDLSNGSTTYGGGRYLTLSLTDIHNGSLIIDFNKSYNPWCAYSDGYNCPIPPKENHLDIYIEAGEKMYTGTYKKK